jgi:adenosylcobinamide-GDP ribazoletransferase
MAERVRAAAHDAATAVLFLTRLPVPWIVPDVEGRLSRATPWFPVVGVAIGAAGALAWWAGTALADPLIGAVAAVVVTALLTGAFHEDGLADTFDGLGASPERERALAIMKDSRVGTYGALALMLAVLARVVALTSLGAQAPAALIGAHMLARFSSLALIRALPYARADGGTGQPFAGGIAARGLGAATAFVVVIAVLLWGANAIAVALAGAGVVSVLGAWFRRRLGGITGDTLGATNQLVEVAVYLALLGAYSPGVSG